MQDRSSFENEWEKAFAEAKSTPPDSLWHKLELDLANSTSGMYKRRLTFFKLLAAASIFLAFSVGGVAVYLEYFHLHENTNVLAESAKPIVPDSEDFQESEKNGTEDLKINRTGPQNGSPSNITKNDQALNANEANEEFLDIRNDQKSSIAKVEPANNTNLEGSSFNSNELIAEAKDVNGSNKGFVNESEKISGDKKAIEASTFADEDFTVKSEDLIKHGSAISMNELKTNVQEGRDNENIAIVEGDMTLLIDDDTVAQAKKITSENVAIELSGLAKITSPDALNSETKVTENTYDANQTAPLEMPDLVKGDVAIATVESELIPEKLDYLFEPLKIDADISDPDLRMVPWYVNKYKRQARYQRLWAGVGVSRGSFDPNGLGMEDSNGIVNLVEDFEPTAQQSIVPQRRISSPSISNETQGSSLNLGVNFGTRFAKRWVIQGGLTYLEQNTVSSSNIVAIENANSDPLTEFNDRFSLANNDIVVIDNYDISNSYKSVSIPLQAGFILLDRKFNITLLGGVSNDFLVLKSINDDSGMLERVTLDAEEVSNLNIYNISALMGSELGYNFGRNYSISLNPQFRRSLNSFNQGNGSGKSYPVGIEIGFRFKYLLK